MKPIVTSNKTDGNAIQALHYAYEAHSLQLIKLDGNAIQALHYTYEAHRCI
jgi:hypothetical protein